MNPQFPNSGMDAAERDLVSRELIAATHHQIGRYIRRTPLIVSNLGDFGLHDHPVTFKLEFMQLGGSFKIRGAFANLLRREVPPSGVVAASGGNHGVAVAYAARILGIPASIFVPNIATRAKVDAIRRQGANLVVAGGRYEDALEASQAFSREQGAIPIHAYDQIETLLGQGTVGLEINEDQSDVDTLFVAVGGGGLIGGIAAWYRENIKLIAVEPDGAPTLHSALSAGRPVNAKAGSIAADSLAPRQVGSLMFPLARAYIASSLLVSDDEIRAAQQALWDELRIVVEPGGATAFAPLVSGRYQPAIGERVAVLLCGGNTNAVQFS
jgi:threonine dehydratase